MSEKKPFSVSASPELIERVESVSDNRSKAVEEALESWLRATSSGEQRLDEIDSEIEDIEEEQEELEQKKQMLLVEREQIEDELERQEEERELYDELVEELAERKADGYPVLDSSKFKRAVSLSEYSGELAVEKVLEEVRDRAGIDEEDEQDTTEVITETADDYDFDLNTGDEE